MNQLFLTKYNLEYISHFFEKNKIPLRVISFPEATNTCYEKAEILPNWSPLNVIKSVFLESSMDGTLYGIVIPETGCQLDIGRIKGEIELSDNERLIRAKHLPLYMSYGSCSPFIQKNDTVGNGKKLKYIVFDTETLYLKKKEDLLDDFSFGLEHQLSLQMNYYQCYRMLKYYFPNVVIDKSILCLSLEERIIRKKGQIKINYQFKSINYRTAKSINSVHGYCNNVSSTIKNNFDTIMVNCIS